MQKTILKKFIQVLLVALLLNSVIFYIASSSAMQETARKDMLYTLRALDSLLDYSGNLEEQIALLEAASDENQNRFTIICSDGEVLVDSGLEETSGLDNHLEREEVQEALRDGIGEATRRSATLGRDMIYVAYHSEKSGLVLRLAAPYLGISEYLPMFLPAAWLSFAVALLASFITTEHFVSTVTRPLREIAGEMEKMKGNGELFHFEPCQYPEINIIGSTTVAMSSKVREYLKQIEQQGKIREEFFSNASHELKTPITSIQGYAELLESGLVKDEAMRQDFIHRIRMEASNMTSLINDILMISRLESREARLSYTNVDLKGIVDEVVNSVRPIAEKNQIYVHKRCDPAVIWADEKQMRELISNLVSNAVKYNRQGGQVWVLIKDEKENSSVVIQVRDNGMGIPEESLPRIFERFYRVEKGRSKKAGGTGLGLAIVKHIVTYYKGTIDVKSKLDEGTEFTVRLPA